MKKHSYSQLAISFNNFGYYVLKLTEIFMQFLFFLNYYHNAIA